MIHVFSHNYDSFTKDLDLLDRRLFLWQDMNTDKMYISWDKHGRKTDYEAWECIVRTIQNEDGSIRYPDRRDIDILNKFNMAKRKTKDIVNDIDEPQKKKKIEDEKKMRETIEQAVEKIAYRI